MSGAQEGGGRVPGWARVLAPVAMGLLLLGGWELAVRHLAVPAYVLPGPVAIARALVADWGVLSAALDEITRNRLNDDLLRLWQAQRFTAVFVTHSVFESVYLSGRVVVMAARPGRVHAAVAVPKGEAPGPRDQAFRSSPGYAALCRTVSGALEGAMAA